MIAKNTKLSDTIVAAIITAIAGIIIAAIQFLPLKNREMKQDEAKDKTITQINLKPVAGTVVDEITNNSIEGAEITIVGQNEHYFTEGNGNFRISVSDTAKNNIRLRVTKVGYHPFDRSYRLPSEDIIIQMVKK